MKNQVMFLVVGLSVLTISSQGFAATFNKSAGVSTIKIVGTVESINTSKGLALIKDKDIPAYYNVRVDSAKFSSLQVGQDVVAVGAVGGVPEIIK